MTNETSKFTIKEIDRKEFKPDVFEIIEETIQKEGALIIRNLFDVDFTNELKINLLDCINEDEERHGRAYTFYGMVHALITRRKCFLDVVEDDFIHTVMQKILGHGTIVHAFNSSSMPPGDSNYAGKIHVDSPRLIPEYITNMVLTIALDPFNQNNGAMEIWPASYTQKNAPSEIDFMNNCIRLENLNAGDAILFNARCWHKGGLNKTSEWRHAIALTACRSFMRQQFDFPKMFEQEQENHFSENLKQFLGYFVRTPQSMDDFLLPAEKRLYKPGQE